MKLENVLAIARACAAAPSAYRDITDFQRRNLVTIEVNRAVRWTQYGHFIFADTKERVP